MINLYGERDGLLCSEDDNARYYTLDSIDSALRRTDARDGAARQHIERVVETDVQVDRIAGQGCKRISRIVISQIEHTDEAADVVGKKVAAKFSRK